MSHHNFHSMALRSQKNQKWFMAIFPQTKTGVSIGELISLNHNLYWITIKKLGLWSSEIVRQQSKIQIFKRVTSGCLWSRAFNISSSTSTIPRALWISLRLYKTMDKKNKVRRNQNCPVKMLKWTQLRTMECSPET
jgi:hypothetical protein